MAEVNPPLFQTIDLAYTAADLGLPYRDIVSEGVAGSGHLAVSQRAAGSNLSVDVAAGTAWIAGDDSDSQPTYRCVSDSVVNLAIAAADGTNARYDLVIAEVRDAAFSGVSRDWRLRVITGTPAGSPSVPSTPDNAIALAEVYVPAGDTTISDAQIVDVRPRAGLFGALGVPTVTSLPAAPYDGQVVDYLVSSSTGVVWRLKYRAAASGTYKWEFVGGSELAAVVDAQQSTTSATLGDLSTVGPSITVPLAGDYIVIVSASAQAAPSAGGTPCRAVMSYSIDGASAVSTDGLYMYASYTTEAHVVRHLPKTFTNTNTPLVAKYARDINAGTAYFQNRRLAVRPVRVG